VFVIVVVVLFCLAFFVVIPHVMQGFSTLLQGLSGFALSFSEKSKWFSGYLETQSQTAYNSSVSAWHDIAFLRSLQAHEKDFIQRMREGNVKNSSKLEEELTVAKNHATDLQSKLVDAEKHAKDLKGKLKTAEKDANDLKGQLTTAQNRADDLNSRFTKVAEEFTKLEKELSKVKTQGCPALTNILETSIKMMSKPRPFDKEWQPDF
jgi:chromosome segregation ATPase